MYLVGGLEHVFFSIIPIDFHISEGFFNHQPGINTKNQPIDYSMGISGS